MGMILENASEFFLSNEVDYYLGPSEKRYFGQNYKKISHNISGLNVSNNCISGNLSIIWPDCWAEKKGKNIVPHIGTLDFFVIAIRFVELYIYYVDNKSMEEMNSMWISHIKCQSNKCIEKSNTKCSCSLLSTSYCSGVIAREYEVLVDNAKVYLILESCEEKVPSSPSKSNLLDDTCNKSYFSEKYKSYSLVLKNIELNLNESFVYADIDSDIFNIWEKHNGLTQAYMPCFTICDLVVAAGQLSQILLLNKSGIARDDSYNLWMRQIICRYNTPINCCAKLKVSIIKSKILNVKGLYYNSVDLCFNFNNGDLVTECKSAYQIQ